MQSYLLGLLEIRLGDTVSARNRAKAFLLTQDSRHPGMSEAMGRELRAELARHSGDLSGALGEIERTQWNFAMSWSPSSAHWGVRQRFLKAELLLGLGRDEEAVPVYESFQWGYDAPWVPLTLLRLSQIRARQGEMERAAFHAARFRALWRDADPALRVLLDSLPGGTAVEGGGGTRPSAPAVAR
jgi:hypothetical protein